LDVKFTAQLKPLIDASATALDFNILLAKSKRNTESEYRTGWISRRSAALKLMTGLGKEPVAVSIA